MVRRRGTYIALLIALSISAVIFFGRNDIQRFLAYGWGDWPTHESPSERCPWKRTFFKRAGLTAFTENCVEERAFDPKTGYAMVFSDADGRIIGKWATNTTFEFTINVLTKQASQQPIDVVKDWYAKLTPDQQKICEIQDADQPLQYFSDGRLMMTEEPHPTLHKIRYQIDVRKDVLKNIIDQYGGIPSEAKYDYMCGHVVGASLTAHPPYFEFDDRSPSKYLMVGSYAQDDPPIDLNSIRF